MKAIGKIHIGTSGWSYKHWKGVFYPPNVKPASYLSFYAEHFSVSEINSSFYKLPLKSTVEKWIQQVPEGFLFCPKMSRYLSHLKKLHEPKEPLERFFNIFEPIIKYLGPILIQLPANLKFNETVVTDLFKILNDDYGDYRVAMEVRHLSWFSDESTSLMRKYNVTLVFAQSDRYPYLEQVTAKDIFIRFHGPHSLYSSSYSGKVLEEYAAKFIDWTKKGHTVWAFFNNDVGGHAIMNAKTLLGLVDKAS
ncbi:DUF72 domain-containing protein [Dyadobacter pollutisoli]|uniref:DUF72 domain-containing protein n=1 Tax=Dyadobacter pollutisoli TaxID=2910158 RepID=A0A9E8SNL3_9BACT|nr:DUF72 domain-containing protein [Dyadobacter pollutisoli]WAC13831.1 DUF72 domain-containing protein [Dyadobacter pollutisoli]